jgi:hypothetical protein
MHQGYNIQAPASRTLTWVTDTWPWTVARQVFEDNLVLVSHCTFVWKDVHGGWNQPGTVLSAEYPPAWEQFTSVNFKDEWSVVWLAE